MKKLTKRVKAGGLWFDVPMFTSHIVINGNGYVWAINIVAASDLNRDSNDWRFPITEGGEYTHIGNVDLEGADWRECCWYVGDQADGESVERRDWMARGLDYGVTLVNRNGDSKTALVVDLFASAMKHIAAKIRAGEIE